MSALDLMMAAAGSGADKLYVDDVFSTYLYTGNGSTQTITNGIDLAGKGGMVWLKRRDATGSHYLFDTARGANNFLTSNSANAQGVTSGQSFTSTGFTTGTGGDLISGTQVSWTFRRAPKFFDIVTYTGNGVAGRQIVHSLGCEVSFITVKSTSTTGDWNSYHRSATGDLKLNLTDAQTASRAIITAADASTFTVSGTANTIGTQYVAYLFAHDPSEDGIIQCGSYVGNGSATGPTVTLGWEPQYILVKAISQTEDWKVLDSMRGWTNDDNVSDKLLMPNLLSYETVGSWDHGYPTANGFVPYGNMSTTYVYMAIRRPNKPPTSGTSVFDTALYTGNGSDRTVTFSSTMPYTDMSIWRARTGATNTYNSGWLIADRLRGLSSVSDHYSRGLLITVNESELTGNPVAVVNNTYNLNSGTSLNVNSATFLNYNFRRAKGFFDMVCDSGTGSAHGITHGLSAAPEFIIRKSRSAATQWEVWHLALAATEKLVLNSTAAKVTDATAWNSTLPTSAQFTVGTGENVNYSGYDYVTYLFATLAGVSKVGSYTGNGSSQTVECGFSAGARFILVKSIDAAGDWFVWDSARGIVAANDPHLSLNTTAAEVTTDDSVDPYAGGFIVNQNTATNINVNGRSYIYLSVS